MTKAVQIGKLLLLPLAGLTLAAGFLWLPPVPMFISPALTRIVVFHVPCSIVGSLATAVGVWYAVRYLAKRQAGDDLKSCASFSFATLLWLLTTVTGAIFARAEWGTYWNWDVKQTSIVMLLLIYVAYFALRAALDDERKRATVSAAYSLFALAAVPFLTLILPNSVPETSTLHPRNTAFSPEYRLVLWTFALCLSLVYLWAFRLQVAIGELELRLNRRARRASEKRISVKPVVVSRSVEARR